MRLVRSLVEDGATSVGVVTPFRAQADALEAAVLADFTVEEMERANLRVGTVHGFQGSERDIVIVSLGVAAEDSRARGFLQDPAVFNVMLTRARHRMHRRDGPRTRTGGEWVARGIRAPCIRASPGTC